VDVEAATKKGIIVLNTPGGNTISAAEHTIAMMLALARNIPQANAALHKGEWNRKKYTGVEFFNKTLGVVGLGRVGAEVAARMKSFGMQILAYDPFVTEERAQQMGITLADLETVIRGGDFITVHTPLTNETRNLIDDDEFNIMKPGVRIVNCARGGIINEAALAKAVAEGKVAGAAVDVFTKEPPTGNPILEQEKIIVTPHLGASTAEAQVNVALAVADQILTIARGGLPTNAINMPAISPETLAVMEPFMTLAEKMDHLLKLSHISRPVIFPQSRLRPADDEASPPGVAILHEDGEEIFHQQRDVLPSFPQWGCPDNSPRKAVEQVAPELPFLTQLIQVAV